MELKNALLNLEDVSKQLNLSKSTLYNLTAKKKIPHFKLGSRLMFSQDDLNQWLQQHAVVAERH